MSTEIVRLKRTDNKRTVSQICERRPFVKYCGSRGAWGLIRASLGPRYVSSPKSVERTHKRAEGKSKRPLISPSPYKAVLFWVAEAKVKEAKQFLAVSCGSHQMISQMCRQQLPRGLFLWSNQSINGCGMLFRFLVLWDAKKISHWKKNILWLVWSKIRGRIWTQTSRVSFFVYLKNKEEYFSLCVRVHLVH